MASLLLPTREWMLLEYQGDLEKRKEDLQSIQSELRFEIGKKPRVAAKSEEAMRQIKFQIKKIKDKYNAQKDDYEKKCSNYQHTLEKQVHAGDANYEPLQAAAAAGITKLKILYEVLSLWSRLEAINQIYNAAIEAVNDAAFRDAVIPIRDLERDNGWQEITNTLKERYVKNLCQESLNAFRLRGTNCNLWTIIGDLSTTNRIPDFNDPDCFHILTNHSNDHTFNKRSQTLESYAYLLCRPERHYWSRSGTAYSNQATVEQERTASNQGFTVEVQRAYEQNPSLQNHVQNWLVACQGKTSVDASNIQNQSGMILLPEFTRFTKYDSQIDMQAGFKKMLANLISCLECIMKSELEGTYSSGNKDVFTPSDTFSVSTEAPLNAVGGVGSRSRADTVISVRKSYLDAKGKKFWAFRQVALVEYQCPIFLDGLDIPSDVGSDPTALKRIFVSSAQGVRGVSNTSAERFWYRIYRKASLSLLTIITDGCRFILVYKVGKTLQCSRVFQLFERPQLVGREGFCGQENLIALDSAQTLRRQHWKDRSIFLSVLLQAMRYSLHCRYEIVGNPISVEYNIHKDYLISYGQPPLIGLTKVQRLAGGCSGFLEVAASWGLGAAVFVQKGLEMVAFLCLLALAPVFGWKCIQFGLERPKIVRPHLTEPLARHLPFRISAKNYAGQGVTGVAYRSEGSEPVWLVKKLKDPRSDQETLLREMAVAASLQTMQEAGQIPKYAGVYKDVVAGEPFLVMEYAGEALTESDLDNLDSKDRDYLKAAIQAMHDGGAHHHDLHCRNILRRPSGGLAIIDFSHATRDKSCLDGSPNCADEEFLHFLDNLDIPS